jgi:hypothetical protein
MKKMENIRKTSDGAIINVEKGCHSEALLLVQAEESPLEGSTSLHDR